MISLRLVRFLDNFPISVMSEGGSQGARKRTAMDSANGDLEGKVSYPFILVSDYRCFEK